VAEQRRGGVEQRQARAVEDGHRFVRVAPGLFLAALRLRGEGARLGEQAGGGDIGRSVAQELAEGLRQRAGGGQAAQGVDGRGGRLLNEAVDA